VYQCQHGLKLMYVANKLQRPADTEARQWLHSTSPMFLAIRCTWLSTVSDRAFPIASARLWNSLPLHVTAAPSLSNFCSRLKSHLSLSLFFIPNSDSFSLYILNFHKMAVKLSLPDKNRSISIIHTTAVPDDQCTAVFTLFRVHAVLAGCHVTDARYQCTEW